MNSEQQENDPGFQENGGHEEMEQEEELQEMDLTPYEEDDDETLHRKQVAAKIARKRAEEDLKLLSNRIALLKQEEVRAYKKIDQTRKKATEIVTQRRRNMETQQEKNMRLQMKLNEEAQMMMLHRAQKDEQLQKIAMNKQAHGQKIKQEVMIAKEEKMLTREQFYHQQNQQVAKATMIKSMIK